MIKVTMFLMLLPIFSYSQCIIWDGSYELMELGNKLEILEDDSGALTYEEVSSSLYQDRFNPSDKVNLILGYTESFFWLRFTIDNISKENLILELSQAGIPQADLYYQTGDSKYKLLIAGYQVCFSDKIIKSSFQAFPIPIGVTSCYIRLNSNSEPIPVRVRSQNSYELSSTRHKFNYGIYLGLMLFVAMNNLFFLISLKKKIYLFYSLIVLLYISYSAAVIDGFIVYLLPNVDLIFLYTTIPAIGAILQTLYCLFFLEVKKYVPKLYKIVLGIVIYFCLWAIAKFFFSFSIVQPINTFNALVSFFVMWYVGFKIGQNGRKIGYYFAIAYFIYFVLVVMQVIYINTGAPEYIEGLSHVTYATLVEAFILSFLLSKQTEWGKTEIEREKLEALRENERIIQQQNIRLEQEVERRTEQLNEVNLELHAANDTLRLNNDEKVIANEILIDQKDQLEYQHKEMGKLINTKDRFFSIISHDLRGPVNSFMGLSALLKQKVEQKEYDELKKLINFMDEASGQLARLLDNLLSWAVGQQGDFPYNPGKVNVKSLIQEVGSTLQNMADSKQIKPYFDVDPQINIYADINSVMTIFRNLINNSLKFTNMGGEVRILASIKNDMVEIRVVDTGIGIPQEKMDTLFNAKEKKSTWGTEGEKGLGLGIQLAYEFSNLNKGDIQVESQVDVGTTFIVKLPLFEEECLIEENNTHQIQ